MRFQCNVHEGKNQKFLAGDYYKQSAKQTIFFSRTVKLLNIFALFICEENHEKKDYRHNRKNQDNRQKHV